MILFCLDCALIVDVPDGVEKVCPKCGQALVLNRDDDRFDHAESLSTVASWALFGLTGEGTWERQPSLKLAVALWVCVLTAALPVRVSIVRCTVD